MIRMVMMALPTTTKGLRARSDRFGGGGTCSGSSAARGLRGEIGGLSLIATTWILPVQSFARPRSYRRIRRNGEVTRKSRVNRRTLDHKGGVGAAKAERVRQG